MKTLKVVLLTATLFAALSFTFNCNHEDKCDDLREHIKKLKKLVPNG